jgi:hypothetical protein
MQSDPMSSLQTLTKPRPSPNLGKTRISPQLREAIRLMVHEGRKRPEAADAVGLKDDSLYRALLRPEVLSLKSDILRAFMNSEAERSFVRTVGLAETAVSEHVKLAANKVIMDQDKRFVSQQHVSHTHSGNVNHSFTPGYIIDVGDEPAHQINNQVPDAEIVSESAPSR